MSSVPPGSSTAIKEIGRLLIWLLARPYVVTLPVALTADAVGLTALGGAIATKAPLWATGLLVLALLGAIGLTVAWLRLRHWSKQRLVVYVCRFAYETAADATTSASHRYMLLQRLQERSELLEMIELRPIEATSESQARRIVEATRFPVIAGHVLTAGSASRREAYCTLIWPDTRQTLALFHRPYDVFKHASGSPKPAAESERLATEAGIPIERLAAERLTLTHVEAIDYFLLLLAAMWAHDRGDSAHAWTLLAAADHLQATVPSRLSTLRHIFEAALHAEAGRDPAAIAAHLESLAIESADEELWDFLNILHYVGTYAGWSSHEERERVARAFLENTKSRHPEQILNAYARLGSCLVGLREYEAARLKLERVLELADDPDDPELLQVHGDLGIIAYQTGDYSEAAERYARVAFHAPLPPHLVHLGDALAALGFPTEALALFQRALEGDPLYPKAATAYLSTLTRLVAAGEGIAYFRSPWIYRWLYVALLDAPSLRRARFLLGPADLYLRWKWKRDRVNPQLPLLLGFVSLCRRKYGLAEDMLAFCCQLPFQNAGCAASWIPLAQALGGGLDVARTNVEWLVDATRNPRLPAAMADPELFEEMTRKWTFRALAVAPRLWHEPNALPITAELAEALNLPRPDPPSRGPEDPVRA